MAILQVEVVVGAIEVGGHHGNIVGAVLQVVALAHLEARNLGNSVLLVGVLQGRGKQAVLLHGLGCVLGVDAGGAQEEQLFYSVSVGLGDDVALDLHVHHDEVSTVEHVGHDAAHEGCGQDNCIGTLFIEERLDLVLVSQIQFFMTAAHEVGVTTLFQIVPDC